MASGQFVQWNYWPKKISASLYTKTFSLQFPKHTRHSLTGYLCKTLFLLNEFKYMKLLIMNVSSSALHYDVLFMQNSNGLAIYAYLEADRSTNDLKNSVIWSFVLLVGSSMVARSKAMFPDKLQSKNKNKSPQWWNRQRKNTSQCLQRWMKIAEE